MRSLRLFASSALFLVLAATWQPLTAPASAAGCHFQLGLKVLHEAFPQMVGTCLDDEAYNAIGDSNQHTTGGLLAWRKSDNWTAFTDGYRTWVNGPFGIQERLNTQRFSWEHDVSTTSNTSSVSSTTSCTALARSGDVSAVGLQSSTTTISNPDGSSSTDVVNNSSSSSSSPGVAVSGC